jgi:hypothetical protein
MTAGSLGGAILVTYAPDPRQLVYVVLLALSVVGAFIPGSCRKPLNCAPAQSRHCGPHVNVPAQASRAMVRVTPVIIATWTPGGF